MVDVVENEYGILYSCLCYFSPMFVDVLQMNISVLMESNCCVRIKTEATSVSVPAE